MNYLTYAAKTSLSKLLVSIILKEQSKFKHQSVSWSLSSSFVGLFEGAFGRGLKEKAHGLPKFVLEACLVLMHG